MTICKENKIWTLDHGMITEDSMQIWTGQRWSVNSKSTTYRQLHFKVSGNEQTLWTEYKLTNLDLEVSTILWGLFLNEFGDLNCICCLAVIPFVRLGGVDAAAEGLGVVFTGTSSMVGWDFEDLRLVFSTIKCFTYNQQQCAPQLDQINFTSCFAKIICHSILLLFELIDLITNGLEYNHNKQSNSTKLLKYCDSAILVQVINRPCSTQQRIQSEHTVTK